MFATYRASGWEVVNVVITLYRFLKELYRDRNGLLRAVRAVVSTIQRASRIGIGGFIAMVGIVMIVAPPATGADFFRQLVHSPADIAPAIFGFSLASLLYIVLGVYAVGFGTWVAFPRSRAAVWAKGHLFKRGTEQTQNPRGRPRKWRLKTLVPAASLLRLLRQF